eukprot:6211904-Pleurochrysis_carterae.AAC.2
MSTADTLQADQSAGSLCIKKIFHRLLEVFQQRWAREHQLQPAKSPDTDACSMHQACRRCGQNDVSENANLCKNTQHTQASKLKRHRASCTTGSAFHVANFETALYCAQEMSASHEVCLCNF